MNKIITGFIAVVAVVSLSQVPLAAASNSFFGSEATSRPFGASASDNTGASNGSFGAGNQDNFFGSGAINKPFGGAVSNDTGSSGSFGAGNQDSFFGSDASNHPFGTTDTTNAHPTSGNFGAGSGSGDVFFGSGASNRPFGVTGNESDPYFGNTDVSDPFAPCVGSWYCEPTNYSSGCDYGCDDDGVDNSNDNVSDNNNDNANINSVVIENYITIARAAAETNTGADRSATRINQQPIFSSSPITDAAVGQSYRYTAVAFDPDGDFVTYALLVSPNGMDIDASTGLIRWTPIRAQSGLAHEVTVVATAGVHQVAQGFQIFVKGVIVKAAAPETEGRVAGDAKIIPVAEASEKSALRAYNIRVDTDEMGNSLISWDTTRPSRGRVMYGLATQGDRPTTADFTGAGQYEFSTPNTPETSTSHRVTLGQLEPERVYYFRVVSFAGTETTVSSERSFVQLGNGETLGSDAGFASVIGTLGSFLISPWFLFLIIIVIILVLVFRRRNQQEILAHDELPVEIHNAGHH